MQAGSPDLGSVRPGSRAALLALGVAVVTVTAIHLRSVRAPFFADDWLFLDYERRRNLLEQLSHADPLGNYFRPLSRALWYTVLDHLGSGRPELFHVANLALFIASAWMLWSLAQRWAGDRAGFLALALFVATPCADVPILWAAGAQDLLALALGLAGVLAWETRHPRLASIAFLAAALSKETALVMPVVAALAGVLPARGSAEHGKPRPSVVWLAAPCFAWAGLWWLTRSLRPAFGHEVQITGAAVLAAPLDALRAFVGLEWLPGSPVRWPASVSPPFAALGLAATAFLAARAPRPYRVEGVIVLGLAWALLAAMPVAAVASIWSGYFDLLAVAGLAVAASAALSRAPGSIAALAVAVLVVGQQGARALPGFALERSPWTSASHVNRAYVERSNAEVSSLLSSMRRSRPTLPMRATIAFAQLPVSSGFQMGDGALLRVAYRDTSLRSYFLGDLDPAAAAARGPILFFALEGNTLIDHTRDPMVLESFAYSMMVSEQPERALGAIDLRLAVAPPLHIPSSMEVLGADGRGTR